MFEVNPNPPSANAITSLAETNTFLAEQVMPKVYQQLQLFASDPTFVEQLKLPFGDTWDIQKAQTLATEWLTGNFSTLAPIKIVTSADINGASGAFADTTNQIYLVEDILTGSNVNQAVSVVLEEIGHSIDPRLNSSDSLGDEGEIFANIVQGKGLSPEQIQTLKSEDDHATITIDGKILSVEFDDDAYDYYSQNWGGEIFDWTTTGEKESKGWYPFTRNDQSSVTTRNSISRNWGNSSPSDVGSDYFGVNLYTITNFEAGNTYNFSVTADDFYRVGVIPVNTDQSSQWINISGQDWNWLNDANNGKQYSFTPTITGEYWVYAGYAEAEDTASFNISWTTNVNPNPINPTPSPSSTDGLESEEVKLYNLVNEYRAQNGLPPIAVSKALTTVANRHVVDLGENIGQVTHAWSDAAYDSNNSSTWPNMWRAPERLNTGYSGYGYEVVTGYSGFNSPIMSAEEALTSWKNSPPHNSVILNQGIWSDRPWGAIGVGLYEGYGALWFGEEVDPTGQPLVS